MPSEIEGIEQINRALENVPRGILGSLVSVINKNSLAMQRYIRQERLTGGTTESKLRVRSGMLRGSVLVLKAETKEDRVVGGVSIGTRYARTHFGPEDQETVITPKKGKYLTIPLPAAMTGTGVLKGSARTGPWGETFIRKTKAGNLIMFGKTQITKGERQGELRSRIVPLFLLKKSVTIPARVHPEEILDWIRPKLIEDLRTKGVNVER